MLAPHTLRRSLCHHISCAHDGVEVHSRRDFLWLHSCWLFSAPRPWPETAVTTSSRATWWSAAVCMTTIRIMSSRAGPSCHRIAPRAVPRRTTTVPTPTCGITLWWMAVSVSPRRSLWTSSPRRVGSSARSKCRTAPSMVSPPRWIRISNALLPPLRGQRRVRGQSHGGASLVCPPYPQVTFCLHTEHLSSILGGKSWHFHYFPLG